MIGLLPLIMALAACGSPASGAPTSPSAIASPASSAAAAPSSRGQDRASGAPGASGRARFAPPIIGTVASATATQLSLTNGQSLAIDSSTRYVRVKPIQLSSLVSGDLVAITAKQQAGGSLQASLVSVFPASLSRVRTGQFPLGSDNLMTNATVQQVAGDHFTARFPGGTVTVTMAPGGQITQRTDASLSDITAGAAVSVIAANGTARQVTLTSPS